MSSSVVASTSPSRCPIWACSPVIGLLHGNNTPLVLAAGHPDRQTVTTSRSLKLALRLIAVLAVFFAGWVITLPDTRGDSTTAARGLFEIFRPCRRSPVSARLVQSSLPVPTLERLPTRFLSMRSASSSRSSAVRSRAVRVHGFSVSSARSRYHDASSRNLLL